ncbi:MAG: 30S ribosomal protein S20, partial [Acidimicrobiia bacterium]|nr:30S ribosomal protein S20 [Acidimicrobiia bacterium]
MANIKSQIKRNRQNERRRLRNKAVRSEVKTRVKRAVQAAESGAEDQAQALRAAMQRIDKAARVVPNLVATVAFVHLLIRTRVHQGIEALSLGAAVESVMLKTLVPALYLRMVAKRT